MPQNTPLAGFWRRFLATLLDVSILAAFIFILTFIPQVKSYLYHLGEATWLGSVILLFYFTIGHSSLMSGQTLGKKILNIQVVGNDGVYLGLWESFMYFLCGFYTLPFLFIIQFLCANILKSILWGGIYLALLLGEGLLIALHPLKKGGSEMICKILVTGKDEYHKSIFKTFYNNNQASFAMTVTVIVSLSLMSISGLFTFMLKNVLANHQDRLVSIVPKPAIIMLLRNDEMFEYNFELVAGKIKTETSFQNIAFHHTYGRTVSENAALIKKANILNVTGYLDDEILKNPRKLEMETGNLANIIAQNYGYLTGVDCINVIGRSGFNIGIASQYQKASYQFSTDGTPFTTAAFFLPKEQIGVKEIATITLTSIEDFIKSKTSIPSQSEAAQ